MDNGESGQLTTPLTTQTLTYIGAASEAVSSPTYTSNHVVSNGDSLTTAIGKLDNRNHSTLQGLSADDHTQYLLVNGGRAMTGDLDMGTHLINNVVDPVANQDAATKRYVDTNSISTSNADVRYVRKDGSVSETVTGTKTFSGDILSTSITLNHPPATNIAVFNRLNCGGAFGSGEPGGGTGYNIYNIGSIVRTGVGQYRVNFTTTAGFFGSAYAIPITTISTTIASAIITDIDGNGFGVGILDDDGVEIDSSFFIGKFSS